VQGLKELTALDFTTQFVVTEILWFVLQDADAVHAFVSLQQCV